MIIIDPRFEATPAQLAAINAACMVEWCPDREPVKVLEAARLLDIIYPAHRDAAYRDRKTAQVLRQFCHQNRGWFYSAPRSAFRLSTGVRFAVIKRAEYLIFEILPDE